MHEESRGHASFAKVFGVSEKASRFRHRLSGRTINLLEFAFLYYRGSPAEGLVAGTSHEQLVARLNEAGFVFDNEQRPVTAIDLAVQRAELQQVVIGVLGSEGTSRGN